jgi:hypothetical protein
MRPGRVEFTNCLRFLRNLLGVRRETKRLVSHTSPATLGSKALKLHATRTAIITDVALMEIRVSLFDGETKCSSATKNVTNLPGGREGRNAHGRLKTITVCSRPKAMECILVKTCRLPKFYLRCKCQAAASDVTIHLLI